MQDVGYGFLRTPLLPGTWVNKGIRARRKAEAATPRPGVTSLIRHDSGVVAVELAPYGPVGERLVVDVDVVVSGVLP